MKQEPIIHRGPVTLEGPGSSVTGDGQPPRRRRPRLRLASFGLLTAIALLLLAPTAASAAPLFGGATSSTTGTAPTSVAGADFNGDGHPDLAVANYSSNSVSVLLGNGGGFGVKTDFATGANPISVTTDDFNGDGRTDLAVADYGSARVSILLGDGSGGFGAKTDFATGTSPVSVTTDDFNGDGRADLAVADYGSASVSILLGNGNGGFGAKTDFATGSVPNSVTTGDFNGDGRPDLAAANYSSNSVSVLLGNGTPTAHPSLRRHAFGRVALGRSSTSQRITFRNGGGAPLEVGTAQLTGDGDSDFTIRTDNCSSITLAVGEACSVSVRFDPETEGFARARLRLTSNAPDSPRTVALSGFAAPAADTDPPETSITSGPAGTTNDNTPTFAFSSDEAGTFECRTDGGVWATCPNPTTLAALTDGVHSFEVRAIDWAVNTDPSPAARSFTVDTTPPVGDTTPPDVFFTSGPAGLTNDPTPTFGFAMNEAGSMKCRTDGAQFTACSSPTTAAALNDGPHSFDVRATDTAGNSSTVSRSIQVDTTAPQTSLAPVPAKVKAKKKKAKVGFSFSADESGSRFECSLDGSAFAACASPTKKKLAKGTHTFSVRSIDRAGNVDASPATAKVKVKKKKK